MNVYKIKVMQTIKYINVLKNSCAEIKLQKNKNWMPSSNPVWMSEILACCSQMICCIQCGVKLFATRFDQFEINIDNTC